MRYRILVDEDVHGATTAVLRDRGHDAVSVPEALDEGAADARVIEHARENGRLVLTHDSHYLDPERRGEVGVLYAPDNELGPGELADRIDQLKRYVPDQADLPGVTYLTGTAE